MEKQKLIRIFDKQATQYEIKREGSKLKHWRQHLLQHAKGEVLELAVGAGANFPFYPSNVKVTAADFSEAMLEKATRSAKHLPYYVDFLCSDIEEMDFPDQSFDTIVSTLSFCSYDHPAMLLDKVNRWCRRNGQVLFMEHGISSNLAFSAVQKTLNPLLYRVYGCHHTRDIIRLIRKSDLKINKVESYWLNSVHLIWASPKT
ncbi:methyltransferase domain-containing protein [Paenibacillus campinasensis]|uniref:Methyltransferase domain-containing protein n=1 Tax=Paenibacillus campinasensis TaxID=66347 RepID=A0ABW9T574_9BACL|nr:class I SAM-dependent methyltransferase [Paenibacillus campinasensis]MUG68439.1 methyltransferase domain-containing protein [Paenibacillus campinasensis]